MSVTPSSGRRGTFALDSTSAKREEAIQRLWSFLSGLQTKSLRVYGESAVVGQTLVAIDDLGNVTFSSTLPTTVSVLTGQTTSLVVELVTGADGEYIISAYMEVTTAGAVGTLNYNIGYTDDVGLTASPILATLPLNATGRDSSVEVVRSVTSNIEYTTNLSGGAGSAYSIYVSASKVR
jgi:hypothetical protein